MSDDNDPDQIEKRVASREREISRLNRSLMVLNILQIIVGVAVGACSSWIFNEKPVANFMRIAVPFISVVLGIALFLLNRRVEARSKLMLSVLQLDMARSSRALESAASIGRDIVVEAGAEASRDVAGKLVEAHLGLLDTVRSEFATQSQDLKLCLSFMNSYFEAAPKDRYGRRKRILTESIRGLEQLSSGIQELSGQDYYAWLARRLKDESLTSVEALSIRKLGEFRRNSREERFIRQMKEAAGRPDVTVTRLYILAHESLLDSEARIVLTDHYLSPMNCVIAWEQDIKDEEIDLDLARHGGFSFYDNVEVFADESRYLLDMVPDELSDSVDGENHVDGQTSVARVYQREHEEFEKRKELYAAVLRVRFDAPRAGFDDPTSAAALRARLASIYEDVLRWIDDLNDQDRSRLPQLEHERDRIRAEVNRLAVGRPGRGLR